MQKERLVELLHAHINRRINPADSDDLIIYINQSQNKPAVVDALTEIGMSTSPADHYDAVRFDPLLKKILSVDKTVTPVYKMRPWKKWAAAAAILAAIITFGVLVIPTKEGSKPPVAKTTDVQAPTTTKATITLADGSVISLDSLKTINQGGVTVIKTADGRIVYDSRLTTDTSRVVYNTLSNPRGSRVIDLALSDGSHVWLNAGSSVTYPVAFVGSERKVQITGEAYFEVAHNAAKPFYVSKGDMQVQVLGTHFNVNAYDDETDIKVTLLEGSVNVSRGPSTGSGSVVRLKPGEQAVLTHDSRLTTHSSVDLEAVLAWKNGRFEFGESTDLKSIMKQVARWYDVEIVYQGNVQQSFGGSISRQVNVSKLLEKFELTGRVKFKIEGRRIVVSQ